MSPNLAPDDLINQRRANAKLLSEQGARLAGSPNQADSFFRELGAAIAFATGQGVVTRLVSTVVFLMSAPGEVGERVVRDASNTVANLKPWSPLVTAKSEKDKAVNVIGSAKARSRQSYLCIAASIDGS